MNKKRYSFIVPAVVIAAILLSFTAVAIGRIVLRPTPSEVAQRAGEAISRFDDTVIATVDEMQITRRNFEAAKFLNEIVQQQVEAETGEINDEILERYPVDDEGIVNNLARKQLLHRLAGEAGIIVTDEDVRLRYENALQIRVERVASGDEEAIKRERRNDEFLNNLGMSEEEYYELIDKEVLRHHMIHQEYALYYYANLHPQTELSLEDYLDYLLSESTLQVIAQDIDVVQPPLRADKR